MSSEPVTMSFDGKGGGGGPKCNQINILYVEYILLRMVIFEEKTVFWMVLVFVGSFKFDHHTVVSIKE